MSLGAGKFRAISQAIQSVKSAKSFWLAFSIVLAFAGFRIVRNPIPVIENIPFLEFANHWNQTLRLDFDNLPNFIVGFFVVLVGTIVFAQSVKRSEDKDDALTFRVHALPVISWKYAWPRLAGALASFGLLLLQLGNHNYSKISLLFWLAPILAISLLIWKWERGVESTNLRLNVDWLDGAWMFALFALAIGSGAYLLKDIPIDIIPDEGSFWETARSIAEKEFQPVFFDFGVYSFPVASSIFQGWVMRLTGINLWGWRFSSVLAASLAVFPLYLLTKESFNRSVAILACALMVVNPYYLTFARLGYNNSQSLFPVTLAIYFFVVGLRRGSYFCLWLAGLAAGLGFYTYFSAWLGLVVIIVLLIILPWTSKIKFRKMLPLLGVVLAGWLIVASPRIVYGISGELDNSLYYKIVETSFASGFYGRAIFGEAAINESVTWQVGKAEGFYNLRYYGVFLARGIARTIFVFFDPALYRDHFLITELLSPGTALFFIFGLGVVISRFRQARYLILNIWFWLGLILLSVIGAFPPRPTHMVAILPVMSILSALGLTFVAQAVIERISILKNDHHFWERITVGLTLGVLLFLGWQTYFVRMPRERTTSFDRTASWMARNVSDPLAVLFIEDNPTTHDATYQSRAKLTRHLVLSVPNAEIQTLRGIIKEQKFMAFIGMENGEMVPALVFVFPNAKAELISNPIGTPLGYVVSNLPNTVEWRVGLGDGLRDLWASPARPTLLFSILAALGMIAFDWTRRGTLFKTEAPFPVQAGNGQIYHYENNTRWPVIDIEFKFHIHFPPRAKNDTLPPQETDSAKTPDQPL